MDLCKSGELFRSLRKAKGMTQKQVADKLGVLPKTVSKWETGHGFPDTSLLSELADILGASIDTLLSGDITANKEELGNFTKTSFFVCPHCGSFTHGIGVLTVSCCGKTLYPLKASRPDDEHQITVNETENEYTVTLEHEMTREHYISFVSYASNDRILTIKLCPEQDRFVSFPKLSGGKICFYCNAHGLFEYEIPSEESSSDANTSLTALMSAFARAYVNKHTGLNLFHDDYAAKMFSEEEYSQLEQFISAACGSVTDYVNTNLAPTPIGRSIFCEEALKTAIKTGTRQYVILGCGFDTFEFRNKAENIQIFEIDKEAIISDKLKRIERAGLTSPENVKYIAADLSKDRLGSVLDKNGFDRNKKTFFSCLGLLYYLTNDEIAQLFENIAEVSSTGSAVVFDFPDSHLFSSSVPRVKNMLAMVEKSGEPMKSCFGYGELEKMLEEHGFLIYEFLNRDEIQHRFFDGCREMTAFENINYALAALFDRRK